MYENINVMNKHSELQQATVMSFVYKTQQTVCKFCLVDNVFLYRISYTPSLVLISHILIPSNT